jgi:hypothetical protein
MVRRAEEWVRQEYWRTPEEPIPNLPILNPEPDREQPHA